MHRSVARTCTALAALAPALLVAAPAAAAPPEHYAYGPVVEQAELCGITATLTTSGRGAAFLPREVPGSDGQAYYAHERYTFTDVWTTAAGTFTVVGKGNSREASATKVPGDVTYTYVDEDGVEQTVTSSDVWTFTNRDSGSYRYYGADGELVLKGTGLYETRYQFDTLGDGMPGGREVPGTFELLRNKTGNSFEPEAECAAAVAALT